MAPLLANDRAEIYTSSCTYCIFAVAWCYAGA